VIARANERQKIFREADDYSNFLDRLEVGLEKTKCRCLAWVLMPNHFHLLIQSGPQGTSSLMSRIMTGYAGYFNRKYRRSGHLFQNRYKSILCDRNAYLLELVRYIHLNPLRANLVRTLDALKSFPWGGHGTLLGYKPQKFQETEEVLRCFGGSEENAKKRYLEYVREGVEQGRREDLVGGGLLRSLGRKPGQWEGLQRDEKMAFDDRILGDGSFVESVLKEVETESWVQSKLSLHEIADRISKEKDVEVEDIFRKGREQKVSQAKALLIFAGVHFNGATCKEMGEVTGMSIQAACKAKERGEALWNLMSNPRKLIS
jgi:putative transposase